MEQMKKCPYCGREILAMAKKCRYCGNWLTDETSTEQVSPTPQQQILQEPTSSEQNSQQDNTTEHYQCALAQMSFIEAIKTGFKKTFTFKGRARRSEYWWFQLGIFLCMIGIILLRVGITLLLAGLITTIENPFYSSVLEILFISIPLWAIIANISSTIRRLHDIGKSGFWYLITLTGIGQLVLLVWCCQDSDMDKNEYGPSPKYGWDPENA